MVKQYFVLLFILVTALIGCSDSARNANTTENSNQEPEFNVGDCSRCIVLTEQASTAILVVDIESGETVWEWTPFEAEEIDHPEWFSHPDEAKPVYNNEHVLITASGGGVALIRFEDKKVLFHAYAGGNPHSAELFPDGNLVSASSTGDHLTIFHVDPHLSSGEFYQKDIPIPFGHNVVWDHKRQVLWSAAEDTMYVYEYNFDCLEPDLQLLKTIALPEPGAHDLFPVYGNDAFWLTHDEGVYVFDISTEETTLIQSVYHDRIKSVSSGPDGYPVIIIHPKEQWWTDEVLDTEGNRVFKKEGMKIYKARWLLDNPFSYVNGDSFRTCA